MVLVLISMHWSCWFAVVFGVFVVFRFHDFLFFSVFCRKTWFTLSSIHQSQNRIYLAELNQFSALFTFYFDVRLSKKNPVNCIYRENESHRSPERKKKILLIVRSKFYSWKFGNIIFCTQLFFCCLVLPSRRANGNTHPQKKKRILFAFYLKRDCKSAVSSWKYATKYNRLHLRISLWV